MQTEVEWAREVYLAYRDDPDHTPNPDVLDVLVKRITRALAREEA